MCYKLNLVLFCLWEIMMQTLLAVPLDTRSGLSLCDLIVDTDSSTRILKCLVDKGQTFDYRQLRTWSSNEKGGKYSVQVFCRAGGVVHLSWPFKAENIVSLQVHDCQIQGFLSEMMNTHTVPDELRFLELARVTIDIALSEMFELRSNFNKISTENDCGQMTLEKLVLQDIHYNLKTTPEQRDGVTHVNGHNPPVHAGEITAAHNMHKSCVYTNLKHIDESGSRISGHYHLKLLPEYAVFPKVEIYNMSRNELSHVPLFFHNLQSEKFPALKVLDFSNNFLRSFEFELPKDRKLSTLQVLDLHNNDIGAISAKTTHKLNAIGTLLVDLRHNPLRCSCRLMDLRQYLEAQYTRTTDLGRRQLVSDITCKLRTTLHGKLDRVSLLDAAFDKKCQK